MRDRLVFLGIVVLNLFVPMAHGGLSPLDRIALEKGRLEIRGQGFITDASHPKRPGDVHREPITFRFLVDPAPGDAVLEFVSGEPDKPTTDRYFVRRGKVFQQNEKGEEVPAGELGDLSPATVAALSSGIVSAELSTRRENVHVLAEKPAALLIMSWNDVLWRVQLDPAMSHIARLERRLYHPVHGDRVEEIRYESWQSSGTGMLPRRVVVVSGDRELAVLEVTSAAPVLTRIPLPEEKENFESRLVADEDISFREVAPHLFAIDLVPTNSRVFVAEFADHVVVLEGVYHSRNCDLLAAKIKERFGKPIRYFAFSHLHGQYVGGVRSYVQSGATVLVPPTTVPLIEQVVAARHDLRPDAQSRHPKPLHTEVVEKTRVLTDDTNSLEIHNIDSDHTDEYLIFYFPRQKVLLTGDLLFYRGPDQPLRGRSLKLCTTVAALGLDVESMFVSWPLGGYGVRNTVTGDEFRKACEAAAAPAK